LSHFSSTYDAAGADQPFVSKCESGQRRIDVVEFAQICAALGVKPSSLLRRWEAGAGT
jgi:DNA-binding Xre family transcriptional regulator